MTSNEIFALSCLGYVALAIGLARAFYDENDGEDIDTSLFLGFIWPAILLLLIIAGIGTVFGKGIKWLVTAPGPAKRKRMKAEADTLAAAAAKVNRERELERAENELEAATAEMEKAQQ